MLSAPSCFSGSTATKKSSPNLSVNFFQNDAKIFCVRKFYYPGTFSTATRVLFVVKRGFPLAATLFFAYVLLL